MALANVCRNCILSGQSVSIGAGSSCNQYGYGHDQQWRRLLYLTVTETNAGQITVIGLNAEGRIPSSGASFTINDGWMADGGPMATGCSIDRESNGSYTLYGVTGATAFTVNLKEAPFTITRLPQDTPMYDKGSGTLSVGVSHPEGVSYQRFKRDLPGDSYRDGAGKAGEPACRYRRLSKWGILS